MSENQTQKTPEEILAEQKEALEKKKAAVKKAKDATLEAKKKVESTQKEYEKAQEVLKSAGEKETPEAKKTVNTAKAAYDAAVTDLEAKETSEKTIRINAAKGKQGDQDYIPEDSEKNLVHVSLEKPIWKQGTKISKPYVQKFSPRGFKDFETNNAGLGYTVEILWNPELYSL